ncbi:MAG: hypothetical protein K6A41_10410 [Bacteroidales bacterium]|nr:hypothetical protein [Bacteroidales bacterium]
MRKTTFTLLVIFSMLTFSDLYAGDFIPKSSQDNVIYTLKSRSTISPTLIERGVRQVATFWTAADGSQRDFEQFCISNYCPDMETKVELFNRLCTNFETIFGHQHRISIELQRPEQVTGYKSTMVDGIFSAYDGMAHFEDDMFANKLAFIVILNFPHFTLAEKQRSGMQWSDLEWGFVRLGDLFTSRVPAEKMQQLNTVTANANAYIDNYDIDLVQVGSFTNQFHWTTSTPLITHWGLRDELKAAYGDPVNGTAKQEVIYDVMKRIIQCQVPQAVIKKDLSYQWYPSTNQVMMNGIEVQPVKLEKNTRYQTLLDFFHAEQALDPYYQGFNNFSDRKFEGEYEISVKETEALFESLLTSPVVKQVAQCISKRLGRKLQPFDIWYDGFKARSTMDAAELDEIVNKKYPSKEAFEEDLPFILQKLGFDKERTQFICDHVSVDASIGAGHAIESKMRNDNAMLRTRIGANGMDYKGYNIGVHEFGHNVEQTISLYDVPNYFLAGVPNTAFTEALAFVFQDKDLQLLGIDQKDALAEDLKTLSIFWDCYEIMGVSLVDMKVWQWLYQNPNATAEQLQEAMIRIAKEVWNTYYAPIFKSKDEPILAIYSHAIIDPLYLPAYPIGHIINFQLEDYLKDKTIGQEVPRIYRLGRLTPNVWMRKALNTDLSTESLILRAEQAVKNIK